MKKEQSKQLLKFMLLSREGDLKSARMVRQNKAWFHVSSLGHESLAACGMHLQKEDMVFMHYRDIPLVMAKGVSPELVAHYWLGKAMISSPARNMSAHLSDRENNIFSSASPTGSQCLPAVGAAWGIQLSKQSQIVVCGIGDAGIRQGEFYEAVCFAIEKQLPILFIIADNLYGISTPTATMNPFRLKIFSEHLYKFADSRQVTNFYHECGEIIDQVRTKRKPAVLWVEMDRLDSHSSSDDHRKYRPQAELAAMQDPVQEFTRELLEQQILTEKEIISIRQDTQELVDNLYEAVSDKEDTYANDIDSNLYGSETEEYLPTPTGLLQQEVTIVEAVNYILREGLQNYHSLIMFGEDIEDPKGGIFGFTKGLSTQYAGRVVNSPLAEATILGVATGLATVGYKPVFELQFVDFIGPALNQLYNQVSSLRWRSDNDWSCPMIIYAPYGAYLPGGGLWHSEAYDSVLASIPGIRVAIPSNPQSAIDLFWTAFQDSDPSFILIPKHLMRKREKITSNKGFKWGQAEILKKGNELTIIAWGNSIEIAQSAREKLHKKYSIEIIDLITLVPCDWKTINESLRKTGRLLVIHEDKQIGGFGASIIQKVLSDIQNFNSLLSPPKYIARKQIPIPFHPKLEALVLPDVNQVIAIIHEMME